MLDLRKPGGWFFGALGVLLTATGLTANFTAPMLDINLNLYFGIFSLIFGGLFLWLARRA
jgi:uncharacterized membrane protein HdeD (DUF308 family)